VITRARARYELAAKDKSHPAFRFFKRNLREATQQFGSFKGALIGAFSAGAGGPALKRTTDLGDRIQKLSIQTGVSTESPRTRGDRPLAVFSLLFSATAPPDTRGSTPAFVVDVSGGWRIRFNSSVREKNRTSAMAYRASAPAGALSRTASEAECRCRSRRLTS
jgi:hypothetical protein